MNKIHSHTWKVTGGCLPPLLILADSFDEAIEEARRRDSGYCAGQIVD